MADSIFYAPECTSSEGTKQLSEEESQHAVKVLRLKEGDNIIVVNGAGGYYKARITNSHHKRCEFEIIDAFEHFGKRDYRLHIAIAPTKNIERLEWFIEKVTEIGIDEITPVICRYSERKLIKPERLEKIIVSAAKQSLKAYFPKLNTVCNFNEFIKNYSASQKYIAHCYDTDKTTFKNILQKKDNVLVLIGPEGDFSTEEVELAIKNGFSPISLGESRLRTETAGIVACHTVSLINQ